jgi:ParB family chromosome partitioning protein
MEKIDDPCVEMIPVDRINVVNPRVRNKKIFREIVSNIAELGLKRPITVSRRDDLEGPRYDIVCGQGRLEAFEVLGLKLIPAMVVEANSEDCMVMSLVENLARRQHRAVDLLQDIEGLKRRGYTDAQIARKIGVSTGYVTGVIRLMTKGELRLLRGVESGQIPLSVAVDIADADDEGIQAALQQAYENKQLRGKKLIAVRRLIEARRRCGKGLRTTLYRTVEGAATPSDLVRIYRDDVEKKRMLVRKADMTRERLVFVVEALRTLFYDENFVTLLRAEGIDSLPRNLAERMQTEEAA